MGEVRIVVAAAALPDLRKDKDKVRELMKCADPDTGFRHFLRYWWFLDQESGKPRQLGEVLWPGQLDFVENMATHDKIYALKARKLGFTTLATAYDGWVARFRGTNERVHLFSRRGDAANEILRAVKYGLNRLPPWMQLPYSVEKTDELRLNAGLDDERIIKAYPADEDTAVEATATHAHIDEWARMRNPQRVWQAIEPSLAGTAHIVTTGMGPANYSATFWMMSMQGDTGFLAFFVDALARPDRGQAWLAGKRRGLTDKESRQEYPMNWKDSLYAGADLIFSGDDLEWCGAHGQGLSGPEPDHRYVKAWDIGRHTDAAVCTVLDIDTTPMEVVYYARMRGLTYPQLQQKIEDVHPQYPGMTVIEKNAAGEAVMENLKLAEDERDGHWTSSASKPRVIRKLEAAIENHDIVWRKDQWPQLHTELDGYQLPDSHVVQDSVMSLSIGLDYATDPSKRPKKKAKARVFQA